MNYERWLPVVGYEGLYEISNFGRVRSLARTALCGVLRRSYPEKIRVTRLDHKGYPELTLSSGGVKKHHHVHTLVLTAFVSQRPAGKEACHNDGDRTNCHDSNLRWDTPKGNQADKQRHGTVSRGKPLRSRTYLSNEQVEAVRSDQRSQRAIAADYGICVATVSKLKSGTPRQDRW